QFVQALWQITPCPWDRRRLSFVTNIADLVNSSATSARSLAVGPVGDEERAVTVDNQVGRLEAVGVGGGGGGKVGFAGRRERCAGALQRVVDHGSAPLAEEETSAIGGGQGRFEVTDTSGRRAKAEVGQGWQRLVGPLVVEVRITVVGAEETVTDADLIVTTVVLIVADEDVQLVVEGDIVDVAQAGGEDVQVAAVGPAAKDAAAVQYEPVALGPLDVAAAVAQRQVEPAVMSGDDAVSVVQADLVLLGRQAKAGQQVAPLVGLARPLCIAQRAQVGRVHDVDRVAVIRQSLDRVEARGK